MINRKLLLIPTALSLLFSVSCGTNKSGNDDIYLDRPEDTNLEFWITQKVEDQDFIDKGCTYLPGWFGASEYLDSRYTAIEIDGQKTKPEIYVSYLMTGYPDTLDESTVTKIEITDPNINVYGLTMNSSEEDIRNRLTDTAKSITNEDGYVVVVIKKCTFAFSSTNISISIPVTNNSGIVY